MLKTEFLDKILKGMDLAAAGESFNVAQYFSKAAAGDFVMMQFPADAAEQMKKLKNFFDPASSMQAMLITEDYCNVVEKISSVKEELPDPFEFMPRAVMPEIMEWVGTHELSDQAKLAIFLAGAFAVHFAENSAEIQQQDPWLLIRVAGNLLSFAIRQECRSSFTADEFVAVIKRTELPKPPQL